MALFTAILHLCILDTTSIGVSLSVCSSRNVQHAYFYTISRRLFSMSVHTRQCVLPYSFFGYTYHIFCRCVMRIQGCLKLFFILSPLHLTKRLNSPATCAFVFLHQNIRDETGILWNSTYPVWSLLYWKFMHTLVWRFHGRLWCWRSSSQCISHPM